MNRKCDFGSILLCLILLTGCSAAKSQPVIPPQLLAPCGEPQWEGRTNGDLVEYVGELREKLGKCNADKAAIQQLLGK